MRKNIFIFTDVQRYNHMKLLNRLPEESGVLLLNVDKFTEEDLVLVEGQSNVDFSHVHRVGGGTIGCDKTSLEVWHEAFYSTFRRYLDTGKFVGKDENMMATTCIETELCLLVEPSYTPGYLWGVWKEFFKLQDWLIGDLPHENYSRLRVSNKE